MVCMRVRRGAGEQGGAIAGWGGGWCSVSCRSWATLRRGERRRKQGGIGGREGGLAPGCHACPPPPHQSAPLPTSNELEAYTDPHVIDLSPCGDSSAFFWARTSARAPAVPAPPNSTTGYYQALYTSYDNFKISGPKGSSVAEAGAGFDGCPLCV